MHGAILYESFSGWFSIISAVTAAIWNIDVLATIAISKSPVQISRI